MPDARVIKERGGGKGAVIKGKKNPLITALKFDGGRVKALMARPQKMPLFSGFPLDQQNICQN